ncbi:MAG: hypothetical protein AAB575_02005 [Patescibacteria group bacterium]
MVIQKLPTSPELPKTDQTAEQIPIENGLTPESAAESSTEQAPEQVGVQSETTPSNAPVAAVQQTATETLSQIEKSEDLVQIESILSEGLEDLYTELPDKRKEEFKQKGEETARSVEKILMAAKFHAQKVVNLIVSWLKMIPGVNKFFLEQDSKIKTDKLIEYRKEKGL